jgi:large subunit ribosomal protein L1
MKSIKKPIKAKVEKDMTIYSMEEAIKHVKDNSKEKFDASVEVHIFMDLDPKKVEHNIRYTTTLPNGTGKTKKVAVMSSKKVPTADLELSEEDLDKILSGQIRPRVDFDVFVAEPKYMPKIAKVAKVLGPVGAMPNPKTGTVTDDIEKAVEQIKKGKVEIRTEKDTPLVHSIIGKVSFEDAKLVENLKEIFSSLKQNRPTKTSPEWIKSISVCSSMGPSFRVDTSYFTA